MTNPKAAPGTAAKKPPKGYWIAHLDVTDQQRFAQYYGVTDDALARFGGSIIARGGNQFVVEGEVRKRTFIVEFDSMKSAMDCYDSAENQTAKMLRASVSRGDLVIVEGYDDQD